MVDVGKYIPDMERMGTLRYTYTGKSTIFTSIYQQTFLQLFMDWENQFSDGSGAIFRISMFNDFCWFQKKG